LHRKVVSGPMDQVDMPLAFVALHLWSSLWSQKNVLAGHLGRWVATQAIISVAWSGAGTSTKAQAMLLLSIEHRQTGALS